MIGLNRILQKGAHLFSSRGLSCCHVLSLSFKVPAYFSIILTLGKVVIPREHTKMLLISEGYLHKKKNCHIAKSNMIYTIVFYQFPMTNQFLAFTNDWVMVIVMIRLNQLFTGLFTTDLQIPNH